jgi:hypothetical protein
LFLLRRTKGVIAMGCVLSPRTKKHRHELVKLKLLL